MHRAPPDRSDPRTSLALASRKAIDHLRARPDDGAGAAIADELERALNSLPRSREERTRALREEHPRNGNPWSDQEDAMLLRMHGEGAQPHDIAQTLKRSPASIRARIDRWLGPSWRARDRGA